MQSVKIENISITKLKTDVIVNAANEYLQEGGGVCGAIFAAAGREDLRRACNRIGHCDTGSAVITQGYRLCRYIIHAVGPVWTGGHHHEGSLLYGAYRSALNLAKEYDCHSIGFPLISSGIYGYPVKEAWEKAVQAVNDWFKSHPDYDLEVVFAVLDEEIMDTGKDAVLGYMPVYAADLSE